MRKLKLSFFASLFAAVSLAACGAGTAHAATLANSFADDNGALFNLAKTRTVEKVAGGLTVTLDNGTAYSFADASGGVWSKLLASPEWTKKFVTANGALYINVDQTLSVICYGSQRQTAVSYNNTQPTFYNDGCALAVAVKNGSN